MPAPASDSGRFGELFDEFRKMRWSPLLAVIAEKLHQGWRFATARKWNFKKAMDAMPFSRMG